MLTQKLGCSEADLAKYRLSSALKCRRRRNRPACASPSFERAPLFCTSPTDRREPHGGGRPQRGAGRTPSPLAWCVEVALAAATRNAPADARHLLLLR